MIIDERLRRDNGDHASLDHDPPRSSSILSVVGSPVSLTWRNLEIPSDVSFILRSGHWNRIELSAGSLCQWLRYLLGSIWTRTKRFYKKKMENSESRVSKNVGIFSVFTLFKNNKRRKTCNDEVWDNLDRLKIEENEIKTERLIGRMLFHSAYKV